MHIADGPGVPPSPTPKWRRAPLARRTPKSHFGMHCMIHDSPILAGDDNYSDQWRGNPVFATTHWSIVTAARNTSSVQAVQADEALEKLCRAYWHPLYALRASSGSHSRGKGSGRNNTAWTTLSIPVLAPMPSASVSTVTARPP